MAQAEPDPYQAQTYRFGLLEDFDHLYRYSAMLDRLGECLRGHFDVEHSTFQLEPAGRSGTEEHAHR